MAVPILSASCPACDEPIVWVHTTRGKSMPINPEPVERGGYLRLDGGRVAFVQPAEGLHIPHNETCRKGGLR